MQVLCKERYTPRRHVTVSPPLTFLRRGSVTSILLDSVGDSSKFAVTQCSLMITASHSTHGQSPMEEDIRPRLLGPAFQVSAGRLPEQLIPSPIMDTYSRGRRGEELSVVLNSVLGLHNSSQGELKN